MVFKQWRRRDKTRFRVHCTSTLADPNPNPNLTLTLIITITLNNINEWENALKTHKTKNNFKERYKKNTQNKTVITIIFYGKLWSCKRAYRYASVERTPIWEYPKIGPWFEIIMSVDTDLRSGCRLETGRRSESIIYTSQLIRYIFQSLWFLSWFP